MLDYVDDSSRLLSMKMALLKYSSGDNREKALSDYEELVLSIDSSKFDKLIEKIKQADYNSLSLEDKLNFLEELEREYDQFNEHQCKIRKFHSEYASYELQLADLSCIDIEALREMKNAISGYLSNKDSIANGKVRIEEINRLLVLEEKKRLSVEERIQDLEKTLLKNFLDAEGRRVSLDVPNKMEYASILKEYKDNGIDLENLLNDSSRLNEYLKEASKDFSDGGESLSATMFCYEKNPTPENKTLLDTTRLEVNDLEYRLILYEIANSLSKTETTYEGALNKREIISRLIKKRSECLKKKGIKFYIDPFSRTRINEQIEKINTLGNNSKSISKLKKELGELSGRIEEMTSMNTSFLITINSDLELLKEELLTPDLEIASSDQSMNFGFDDILPQVVKEVSPNQVVSKRSLGENFNERIAKEQARSVVVRVCSKLFESDKDKTDKVSGSEVIPELVIVSEPEILIEEPVLDFSFSVNDSDSVLTDESLFKDEDKIDDIDETISFEDNQVVNPFPVSYEPAMIFETKSDEDTQLDYKKSVVSEEKEQNEKVDLFTSVSDPFESPIFFASKVDDESVEVEEIKVNEEPVEAFEVALADSNSEPEVETKEDISLSQEDSLEDTMPDVFWETQSELMEDENADEVISLDDQIDSLLASEPKTKRLAA